ncbi:MAG: diacylglycerol kinase [Gammaproteobacteria bacterium]
MASERVGLDRLWRATGYSIAGFKAAWRHEAAFRQECALGIVLAPVAAWLGRSPLEYLVLVAPLLIVLCVELLNSAVEALTDRVGTEQNELAGRAKDMGSAAVFVSLVLLALCWGTVLWHRALGTVM